MGQRIGFSPKDIAKVNAMYCSQQNGPDPSNGPGKRPAGSPFYPGPGYYPGYPDYYYYPEYPNYGAPYPPNYGPFYNYRPPINQGSGFYPPRPFPKKDDNEV